jgi:hypothetical protein
MSRIVIVIAIVYPITIIFYINSNCTESRSGLIDIRPEIVPCFCSSVYVHIKL